MEGYRCIIEFKKSGNYVLYETEGENMVTNNLFGKYSKNDSIIFLDKKIGQLGISKTLKIVDLNKDFKPVNKFSKKLIQIDDNGNELKDKISFKFQIKQ